jgi:hypothetical protein
MALPAVQVALAEMQRTLDEQRLRADEAREAGRAHEAELELVRNRGKAEGEGEADEPKKRRVEWMMVQRAYPE